MVPLLDIGSVSFVLHFFLFLFMDSVLMCNEPAPRSIRDLSVKNR